MMKIINSIPDVKSLQNYLNQTYNLQLDSIYLHRDMIGAVYFVQEKDKRYVYKLYRAIAKDAAIQATQIIAYLTANNFPVVPVILTKQDELYSVIKMPEGDRVGILFEYIEGTMPVLEEDILLIGQLTGKMHRLMDSYPGELCTLDRYHYLDRFIEIMRERFTEQDKVTEMEEYASELWNHMVKLPKGFCHGDLHTGNLIKTQNGEIYFLDFDISSKSYPIFDVATICDDTDFRVVEEKDIEQTYQNFEKFYTAYSKERTLSQLEKSAIFHGIAIHHYELNGTIPLYRVPMEGNHWLNDRYFNIHYQWVMAWKDIFVKKKKLQQLENAK